MIDISLRTCFVIVVNKVLKKKAPLTNDSINLENILHGHCIVSYTSASDTCVFVVVVCQNDYQHVLYISSMTDF